MGRRASWTDEQRARVLELLAAGESQRRAAVLVFGDARFRGRVERIVHDQANPRPVVAPQPLLPGDASGEPLTLRAVVEHWKRVHFAPGAPAPSLADLERLLRIERQLDQIEDFERLRELTSDPSF